jgi:hypothetical protein
MTIVRDGAPATYTVLFFDASGEQLDDPRTRAIHHKYTDYADALILFADPRTMSKVTYWLVPDKTTTGPPAATPKSVPPLIDDDSTVSHSAPDQKTWRIASTDSIEPTEPASRIDDRSPSARSETWTEAAPIGQSLGSGGIANLPLATSRLPHQLIQEFAGHYLQAHGRRRHEKIALPISLVITKADELRRVKPVADVVRELIPPPRIDTEPETPSQQRHHLIDILETSQRVRGVLKEIAEPGLLVALEQFSNVTYHAVSATGCGLNQHGRYPFVRPQRVAEPFVSLLLRLNILGND